MADELTIKVVSGGSETLHVRVELSSCSVLELKQQIQQQDASRFPVAAQRLIFQGQILQDAKLLSDYHVAAGCALHLTLTPGAVAAAQAAAQPNALAQFRTFLAQMKQNEPADQFATAIKTLQKICANIVGNPTEDKYRKLRVDNAALKARLFDRNRGQDCVKLLGFQDGVLPGHLVLVPTPEKWENLVACKTVVDSEVAALGASSTTASSPFGTAPSMGMGGDFAAQAQAMLQNPAMLQSMANNPMVQQMAQQNPMLAQALQNPALLAQSMQALQQNPAMMQQLNQMMSDPNATARMQQMMAGGGMGELGGLGGYGGAPFGAAPAPVPSTANPFASPSAANPFGSTSVPAASNSTAAAPVPTSTPAAAASSADNDDEEDEIAKAIARSLQDQ